MTVRLYKEGPDPSWYADRGRDQFESTVIGSAGQISSPLLREFYAYWQGKRNGRRWPARADLDPLDIPRLLPHVAMLDIRRDPLDLVCRLMGTQVVGGFGAEMTRLGIRDLPMSNARDLFEALAASALDGQARRIGAVYHTVQNRSKHIDWLALPLSSDGQTPNLLFGGAIIRTPPSADHELFLRPHPRRR